MELLEGSEHYIVRNGRNELWCSRLDGTLSAQQGNNVHLSKRYSCLGTVYGVIGKFRISHDTAWRLVLIRQQAEVGVLPGNKTVYKISRVLILTLSQAPTGRDLDIDPCRDHCSGRTVCAQTDSNSSTSTSSTSSSQKSLQKTWNQFKQAAENIKPKKIPPLGDLVGSTGQAQKDNKEKEKFERKVLEEVVRMFNDSESFYYSPHADITNTMQREQSLAANRETPLWERADDRFFWNKTMLQDLVDSKNELCETWLVPVIQGFVQIESCPIQFEDDFDTFSGSGGGTSDLYKQLQFKLCIVSRRSRFRAGTRYKRRGVDEEGHTANYVETEQILEFTSHIVSFVQVRGSVPLFWSQTGIKYKPPPRIERGEDENHSAFSRHFCAQLAAYGSVTSVCLVDRLGKEKVIADAFLKHILTYNDSRLSYVAFDFHEYCRGMRFENVSLLTEHIMDMIRDMRYCWVDQNGTICEQNGVFRVNCIDCLDRTNIVQSAIARIVLEIQCRKLGLLSPERQLASNCRTLYQQMWANNGDIISRQYAGTAALKGDYTRTGERRFAGMMKDGVNSANRYYINRVKDVYRQATIDLLLGNKVTEEDISVLRGGGGLGEGAGGEDDTEALVQKEENLKVLIDECKKMLITEADECLGGWGLINCEDLTEDPSQHDMDSILLLSQKAYYIAHYDDEIDQVTSYQEVLLEELDRIELGVLSLSSKSRQMCVRVHYTHDVNRSHFHTFCTTNTRLFNNIVVVIRNEDEAKESLRAIAESFLAARKLINKELVIAENKLDRKKSRPHLGIIDIACQATEQVESSLLPISRDPSSHSLRTVRLSPSMHRKASPTPSPKLPPKRPLASTAQAKLGNIRRTMAEMIPVKKLQLSNLRLKIAPTRMFLSTATLRKDDRREGSPDVADHFGLKPESLSLGRGTVGGGGTQELLSNSDSELSIGSDLEILMQGGDSYVVLRSCGILCTSARQVLSTLLQNGPVRHDVPKESSDTTATKTRTLSENIATKTDGCPQGSIAKGVLQDGLLARKREQLIAQYRSRSLDLDVRLRNKLLATPAEQLETRSDVANKIVNSSDVKQNRSGFYLSETDRATRDRIVAGESAAGPSATGDLIDFEDVDIDPLRLCNGRDAVSDRSDDDADIELNPLCTESILSGITPEYSGDSGRDSGFDSGKNSARDTGRQASSKGISGEISVNNPSGPEPSGNHSGADINEETSDMAFGGARLTKRRPTIMLDDKEVTTPSHPPLERRRSLLKLSYSEGALAAQGGPGDTVTLDSDELDDLDTEELAGAVAQGSAFAKLRVRMASLALPAMQQPIAQQRALQQTARNNANKSRLRFRECKTRILLL